jgi:excisionase family DNA binding protein
MHRLYTILEDIKSLLQKQYTLQKEYLSLSEAAQFLGISESSLYKLTSSRSIPFYKPNGKLVVFSRKDLESWLTRNPKPALDVPSMHNSHPKNKTGRGP